MKRLFDILFSITGIIILLPAFVIIPIIIKTSMPGPVFFIQKRVGLNGRLFNLLKYRTMTVLKETEDGSFDAGDSSRVTRIGKFLRKNKLDEIPQLINVLKGEMSIVGPRPEIKKWTMVYPEKWKVVHAVKPGITDSASIKFRNEEEILAQADNPEQMYKNVILVEKLKLYIDYVNNQTFWGDIKIIFKTIKAVL